MKTVKILYTEGNGSFSEKEFELPDIKDNEMDLIRKMIRRLDISDVESEGARKEVEQNLYPEGRSEEES